MVPCSEPPSGAGAASAPPSVLATEAGTLPRAQRAHEAARKGRLAEQAACDHLEGLGWTVLGRNVRVSRLEIDLLAREGDVVVVVEVRHRGPGAWQRAFDSVGQGKRLRIRRAGESLWRTHFKHDPSLQRMRFDIVAVTLDMDGAATVEHLRAAF